MPDCIGSLGGGVLGDFVCQVTDPLPQLFFLSFPPRSSMEKKDLGM